MNNVLNITIGDMIKAAAKALGTTAAAPAPQPVAAPQPAPIQHGWCIVVLDRGWVYVGDVEERGGEFMITNASNIRCWGTGEGKERGLGRLAKSGPAEDTKLDAVSTYVLAPKHAVISLIGCNESAWQ